MKSSPRKAARGLLSFAICMTMILSMIAVVNADSGVQPGNVFIPTLDNMWQKDDSGNILTNFYNMYQPEVVYEPGEEYCYKMWFFGWAYTIGNPGYPGFDSIFHARSKDMVTWEVWCGNGQWDTTMNPQLWAPVLSPDSDKYYENIHSGDPSVVKKDGKYYMAYTAMGTDLDMQFAGVDGYLTCVMGAVSEDGINWTKTTAPILINNSEIGIDETPIRFDTQNPYYGDYARPSLMYDNGKWKIWFDYWASVKGICMGYAENDGDFMNPSGWQVVTGGADPQIANWPNPDVVKVGDTYVSYADPIVLINGANPDDHPCVTSPNVWEMRQLAEAVSKDGINWTVTGWITPGFNPAQHVPQALVIENTLYLFYAVQGGYLPDGTYDYTYKNIQFMERELERTMITGGGWIDSPKGAYQANTELRGKSNFSIEARLEEGAVIPEGQTKFNFKPGKMDFCSTGYDWMTISGDKAQYRGSGTINGEGDYGFIVTVVDGKAKGQKNNDQIRIMIWDKATGAMIYDNQPNTDSTAALTAESTLLGGGNITVHGTDK